MGYTHYYNVASHYDKEHWNALVKDVKKLLTLGVYSPSGTICYQDLVNKPTVDNPTNKHGESWFNIDETEISFNGRGELSHEQFQLYRRMPPDVFEYHEKNELQNLSNRNKYEDDKNSLKHPHFEFTKTARKPYDIVVCCCLLLAKKHFGEYVSVSSDGDLNDGWANAIHVIENSFGYKVKWNNKDRKIISVK